MESKQDWLEFLTTQQAHIEQGQIIHFGDPQKERQAITEKMLLLPLDNYGVIRVTDEEAEQFLQNQLSNDMRLVSETHSQLNAYCNPKGRVLSLFRVIRQGDDFFLLLPEERLSASLQRLNMFVLRSKVSLEDASEHYGSIGLSGPDAKERLVALNMDVPEKDNECIYRKNTSIVKIAGHPARYLIFSQYPNLKTIWSNLNQQPAYAAGSQVWSYLNIQAGIPEVCNNTSEEFVPQMLNLHSLNGVSFQKGCYPGQEVVARMHYLGKQKRRMYLAHIATELPPQAGDNVYSKQDASGQSVGKIASIVPAFGGGYDALVVMQIKSVEDKDEIYTKNEGILIFKELPYSVEVEGKK